MTLLQTSGRLDEQSAWLASLRAQQVTFTLSITVADVQRLGLPDIYTTLRAPLKAFIVASNGPSRAFLLKNQNSCRFPNRSTRGQLLPADF